jgi:hypothetical protein
MTDGAYPLPTPSTVRELYGSAYRCAHPECTKPLYKVSDETGDRTLNSRVAHIHARKPGGPRWIEMPPDENRGVDNLLLLCIEHSYEIDEAPERFPAEMLREWKAAQIAEYDRLHTSWPLSDEEVTEALVASESFDALNAPSTIELVRQVEALRLTAMRSRDVPRSWSRKREQLKEQARRSFFGWDVNGNTVYAEPSEVELRPIREGLQSALATARGEVLPAADAALIELAAVRATRPQIAPWCDALEHAIIVVIDMTSTWPEGPDPTADNQFDTALNDLSKSISDLVRASRGEQVDLPKPPPAVIERRDLDPLAGHRDLLEQARPYSRVSHRPYDPELRERLADATRDAAALPFVFQFASIGLDTTARLAIAVAGNAGEAEQLELVERDRQRLPICAAAALLSATTLREKGQPASAAAAREALQRLLYETDWSDESSWAGNDINGRSMMQAFADATSDEAVRDRLTQALETNPEVLTQLSTSCASWVEEHDRQTRHVRLERTYDQPPPWLPMETIRTLAADVLNEWDGLDNTDILKALLQKLDRQD